MAFRNPYPSDRPQRETRRLTGPVEAASPVADLLSILWRRKLVIATAILVCVGTGLLYILLTPPRYMASTSILIDPRLGKSIGSDPVTPGFVPDTSAMDSQIKLFTSQTVLDRVARMADLAADPEFNGSQRSLLQRILHPRYALVDNVDLKALENAITIKRPERTYVVGIDVLARDPGKAAEIANDLTRAYIEDQVSARVGAAESDATFVSSRLAAISDQIKDAETKVEAYKIAHDIVDVSGLRSNEQQVSDLTRSLGDARAKASATRARMVEIDAMARDGHIDASSEALKSLTMERLRQQEAEIGETVANLAATLGAQHPQLIEAESRQRKIERLIRNELQRLKISAGADYRQALDNERSIEAQVKGLKASSADMNRALVPLDQLERKVKVLHASFDRFAQIRDNLSQQEASSPPGRVIAIARPPVSPSSPKKVVVGSISLAAGVFFGLAAALLAEGSAPARRSEGPAPFDTLVEVPRRPVRRYLDDDDARA